jgi:hypothetical protein
LLLYAFCPLNSSGNHDQNEGCQLIITYKFFKKKEISTARDVQIVTKNQRNVFSPKAGNSSITKSKDLKNG